MSSAGAEPKLCCCNAIAGNNTKKVKVVAVRWNRNRNWNWNWKKHLAEKLIVSTCGRRKLSWCRPWCNNNDYPASTSGQGGLNLTVSVLLVITILYGTVANAATLEDDTLSNVPQTLSGEDCKKARIQRPKSRDAERCTVKCVTTCIRGGAGSPGEGPLNARRPLVVFKEGFHSRKYCLVECSDICNLIKDGEDGP